MTDPQFQEQHMGDVVEFPDRQTVHAQAQRLDRESGTVSGQTGPSPASPQATYRAATSGKPLTPEQAGSRYAYAVDVTRAGVRNIPEALYDGVLNNIKHAHLREGGHHRGAVLPQNRNAYHQAISQRRELRRAVAKAVFTKPVKRAKISRGVKKVSEGRSPRWLVAVPAAAEVAEVAAPTNPTAAWVANVNHTALGLVGDFFSHAWELIASAAATPAGMITIGTAAAATAGHAAFSEHRRRQDALAELLAQDGNADIADAGSDEGYLTLAFRAAGVIASATSTKPGQHVTLTKPIVNAEDCWVAELELPPGCTVSKVRQRHEALAGALDADTDRVRILKGSSDRRLSLRVYEQLPLAGEGAPYPLATAATYNLWDGAPFGTDLYGQPMVIDVVGNHSFAGGATRNGKTFSERVKASAAVLDPYVRLSVMDFKPVGDWVDVRHVAHDYIEGTEENALTRTRDALLAVQADLGRRMGLLSSEAGRRHGVRGQVNRSMTRDKELDCPLWLIFIDEIQQAVGDPRKGDRSKDSIYLEILTILEDIARRGAAVGVMLCLSTQAPDGNILPGPMWDQLGIRFALSVGDTATSDAVLGKGSAASGADASDLVHQQQRGAGFLKGTKRQQERFVLVKSYNVQPDLFAELCERGRQARIEAGTLSGQAAQDEAQHGDDQDVATVHQLRPAQVDEDAAALIRAAAEAYAEVDEEWITAAAITQEIALGELGWSAGRATDMAVSAALQSAGVTKDVGRDPQTRSRITRWSLADILAAAERLDAGPQAA